VECSRQPNIWFDSIALYSFDLRAERWRRREAIGDMIIVRYANDIVVGFEHETDARRFWDAMRDRLQEFHCRYIRKRPA
jgi:hypothetical protein